MHEDPMGMTRVLVGTTFVAVLLGVGGMGHAAGGAQQQAPAPRYTPAPGAKDLKAVLFNWAWYMGMLRGPQEVEAVATLEHQATGTIQIDGQPCRLTKYRMSNNYQVGGQRIQYACTRANGQAYTAIEVVSGQYAWDEDILGAEIVPGKGKATPKPALLQERLIRLWASPQGAPKAAAAGRDKTTVAHDTGKPVVTYPIPGVPAAIAKATLNAQNQAERVEIRNGDVVMEFTYADYADFNNPLNKIEAFIPGKLVEKRNGVIVRDLTTSETETGNLYVVMPVPKSVRDASAAGASK
jgi:hypothetical protein